MAWLYNFGGREGICMGEFMTISGITELIGHGFIKPSFFINTLLLFSSFFFFLELGMWVLLS